MVSTNKIVATGMMLLLLLLFFLFAKKNWGEIQRRKIDVWSYFALCFLA